MKPVSAISCDEGHGRLPWMGHVQCTREDCERLFKHAPPQCICGCKTFRPVCAKCFTGMHRSEAQTAYVPMGEMAVPGRGAALE